jgi:signal transduction histidine kinase
MRTPRTLPLAAWVAIFTSGSVLVGMSVAMVSMAVSGDLTQGATNALALGAIVGLLLSLIAIFYAARLAAGLRELRRAAVVRLHEPSAPLESRSDRPLVARTSTELADLAMVLEALHVRVRVGDQVGEQHRRDAQTAGAGVFELLSGLVAAEEGARGQLAAELHDTVAQSLMIARGILGHSEISEADIVRLGDYVEDAEEQVRAVMARTRPPALREGDLATAVGNLRLDMRARYGLVVRVDWPQDPQPLPLASAVTVYRFFQEALLNVVKHADIDEAEVALRIDETHVVASVTDHGPGFDPTAVRPDRGRHVGLGLLRERARLSGGALEVDSAVGEGATLTLRLPRPAITPPAGPVEKAADWPALLSPQSQHAV